MVKNAIKVYARLRPEKSRKNVLNYQVLHRPKEDHEEDFFVLVSPVTRSKDYPDNRPESWNFSFFRIFEEPTTQEDVFENVARPVVESALDGYNGTIFAYGQTASGKTYSITGRLENEGRGILPRSLQHLFEAIRKRPENVYSVEVAYVEIYNETGYDLLDRRQQREAAVTRLEDLPRISTLEDEFGRLHLKNMTFHSVKSMKDAFELLELGDNNRVVAETPMNPQSSRSHCIFTIVVSTKQIGAEHYKRAKVHLVDLAGSERVYKCSITGTILTEAKHINLSLHYLEQVIVCLGQENAGHIPYRNSILTSILRDSLGGNCMTVMLATLSVATLNIEETLSTCRFAQRVALIKNDLKLNLETDISSENALLRAENERLRQQIKALTRQTVSEELTAEDKRNLDCQIRSFLESNEQVCWDCNPKKVQYCFESIKKTFDLSRDAKSCLKKLEYYKDLVIQRDKEISLLIDMMKKNESQRSNKANDNASTVNNVQNDEQDPVVSNIPSKKQKRRPKNSNLSTKKTICNENTDVANVEHNNIERIDSSRSSIDQIPKRKSIFIESSKPDLLPCNVVNLKFNQSIEDNKQEIVQKAKEKSNETNPQSIRKSERKPKSVGKKHGNRVESSTELKNDKSPIESPSTKTKIETKEASIIETDNSVPIYEKFLNFNMLSPKRPSFSKENLKVDSKDSSRKSNFDENDKEFEDSLPLTGDPEIDEEIIAFYKAKRTGGTY